MHRKFNLKFAFILLLPLAACAGKPEHAPPRGEPTLRLIIPDDYRGPIRFEPSASGAPAPDKAFYDLRVSDEGVVEIDEPDRIARSPIIIGVFQSGQTIKVANIADEEVGLRCAIQYERDACSPKLEYFLGSRSEMDEYLRYEDEPGEIASSFLSHRIVGPKDGDEVSINEVTVEAIEKTPRWEGIGPTPLSVEQAIKVAASAIRSIKIRDTNYFKPIFDRATLVRFNTTQGDWYYWRVHFSYTYGFGGLSGQPALFEVIVLMNGRVLPPRFVRTYNE